MLWSSKKIHLNSFVTFWSILCSETDRKANGHKSMISFFGEGVECMCSLAYCLVLYILSHISLVSFVSASGVVVGTGDGRNCALKQLQLPIAHPKFLAIRKLLESIFVVRIFSSKNAKLTAEKLHWGRNLGQN